ncbi:MAG TPA: hypothetical protein VGO09_04335, partial [Flavisolibacter sp.]|nr:hypothetical protein [Flavisolibacter sp.]
MKKIQYIKVVTLLFLIIIFTGCTKEDWLSFDMPLGGYTWPVPIGTPSKTLKIKVLEEGSNQPLTGVYYKVTGHISRQNCSNSPNCDSIAFVDSVKTDSNGEAIIKQRGTEETFTKKDGYWQYPQTSYTYSFTAYDSLVVTLNREVWVKLQIKNINPYASSYVFSPRMECQALLVAFQPTISINKDTSILACLWANQTYNVTLNLYKNEPG